MTESPTQIVIRPMNPGDDATDFRVLNEEWITRHFVLEAKDRETLADPENTILRRGGQIYMVYCAGEAVGCGALIPKGEGVYEVSKMAVSPRLRGLGIGRKLMDHMIDQARILGATALVLGSSTKLPNAVHLYESVGFRHVPAGTIKDMPYVRADVFMEMKL